MTKKILVVDDEPHIRVALQTRLKANGFDVFTAEDGEGAVEKAKAERPDLILMDIMMPLMDGHEAGLAELRAPDSEDTGMQIRVVAVECECLAVAQTGRSEQPKEGAVGESTHP